MKLELPELPDNIKHAKGQALWNLQDGCTGGGCDMTFEEAIYALKLWAEGIDDAYFDDEGYEQDYAAYEASEASRVPAEIIITQYLGRDLAPYVIGRFA